MPIAIAAMPELSNKAFSVPSKVANFLATASLFGVLKFLGYRISFVL